MSVIEQMSEDPENWWEVTPEGSEDSDPDSPNPIVIRGYQREGDQWVSRAKEEADGPSDDSAAWSDYSQQKALATGVFLFSFLVGDWWWDGSNGLGALIQIPSEISDWPFRYSWVSDFHPQPIVLLISWALWDITPAVFLFMFLFGSNIIYSADMSDLKEDSPETRRIGKKANRNLKYFVSALILMDFITFASWDPFAIDTFLVYPTAFFEMRPNIQWMFLAFAASFGLDPDNEWLQRIKQGSNPR